MNSPARVLIVDDDRQNRDVLQVMLGPEGYQVLTASTGEEALAVAAAQLPDVILLDVMMPAMNGYQVATKLKSTPATERIPIILVTALDNRDARMLGMSAGVDRFLSKPVDRTELCERVRDLLPPRS